MRSALSTGWHAGVCVCVCVCELFRNRKWFFYDSRPGYVEYVEGRWGVSPVGGRLLYLPLVYLSVTPEERIYSTYRTHRKSDAFGDYLL